MSYLNLWLLKIVIIDLVIAIGLITGLRYLSGWVANVQALSELAVKDNHAFGVALAGGILAMVVMLSGVVAGDSADSLMQEAILMLSYGLLGIVLIKCGRLLQDKWVLPELPVQAAIKNGNMSAAVVDVANTVATALVVRSAMTWVSGTSWQDMIALILAFLGSQLLMAVVIRLNMVIYRRRHEGACLESVLNQGQIALAFRYLGHLMGVALAIYAASYLVVYNGYQPWVSFASWLSLALMLTLAVAGLSLLARRCILGRVDVEDEINGQANLAIAAVEASIFVGIGFYFVALFG